MKDKLPNKETGFKNVRERIFLFATNVINLCNSLPKTASNMVIINQVLRSATSIGANLEESIGAYTKMEFLYSMNISKKEARETLYWLQLLASTSQTSSVLNLMKESDEIVKILTASVKTAQLNNKKKSQISDLNKSIKNSDDNKSVHNSNLRVNN